MQGWRSQVFIKECRCTELTSSSGTNMLQSTDSPYDSYFQKEAEAGNLIPVCMGDPDS